MFWHKKITSYEEAARQPQAVRRLELKGSGYQAEGSYPSFEQFAQLLQSCAGLQELDLGWFSWGKLPESWLPSKGYVRWSF